MDTRIIPKLLVLAVLLTVAAAPQAHAAYSPGDDFTVIDGGKSWKCQWKGSTYVVCNNTYTLQQYLCTWDGSRFDCFPDDFGMVEGDEVEAAALTRAINVPGVASPPPATSSSSGGGGGMHCRDA